MRDEGASGRGIRSIFLAAVLGLLAASVARARPDDLPETVPAELRAQARFLAAEARGEHGASGTDAAALVAGRRAAALVMSGSKLGLRTLWRRVAVRGYAVRDPEAARDAIDAMFALYDSDGMAFFRGEVRALAREPRVHRFLVDLAERLAQPDAPFDLWGLALSRAGGDEAEALRWLAVIFQDLHVNASFGPIRFIEDRSEQELWCLAILMVERASRLHAHARLYPDGVGARSGLLYHYYVPAYLAARLRAAGHSPEAAFIAPFVMNTEYERLQLEMPGAGDEGPLEIIRAIARGPSTPFRDLGRDEGERAAAIADIDLGYRGRFGGSGRTDPACRFDEVDRGLRRDPQALVRRLVRGEPPRRRAAF